MIQNIDKKKEVMRRLRIIEGHLKKVTKMVEDDEYCIDILQQTCAVKNSLKRVEDLLLDNHLRSCVVNAIKKDRSEKSIRELLELFKEAKK